MDAATFVRLGMAASVEEAERLLATAHESGVVVARDARGRWSIATRGFIVPDTCEGKT
jgi:hypothetical protein